MIITPDDLGDWMKPVNVDAVRATQAIRIAEGWLLSATRLDPWPDKVTAAEDLRSWVMELAALCYVNNPSTLTQRQVGGVITSWAPDAQARRQQIIDAARSQYNTRMQPKSSFPCAQRWPDEAREWAPLPPYYT